MKVKIENQLFFAEVMKLKSEESLVEHAKWDGYCQGLKYCLCVLSGQVIAKASSSSDSGPNSMAIPSVIEMNGRKIPVILTSEQKECVCSPADLEPFGECQCGK